MSAAHTPGPWALNKADRKPIVGFDPKDGGGLLPIAVEVQGYSLREARANAKLIAAAPDMAEALRQIKRWLRSKNFDPGMRDGMAFLAENALHKAGVEP